MTFDFLFSRVTNVHFGGNWLVISLDGLNNSGGIASGSIDFPGMAGGTPGINVLGFGAYPQAVTAADISAVKRAGAGLAVHYFGVSAIGGFSSQLTFSNSQIDVFGFSHATQVLVQAPSPNPFNLRVKATGGGGVVSLGVSISLLDGKDVKPGMALPQFGVVEYLSPKSASYTVNGPDPLSLSADFMVDPTKMTVTGSN